MIREATIEGEYRYDLWRIWGDRYPYLLFIGLNPSTADHQIDDPTTKRCIGFAKSFGYEALVMVNLFAYRTTDPTNLQYISDSVGPRNMEFVLTHSVNADKVIVCWGSNRGINCAIGDEAWNVCKRLRRSVNLNLYCLGTTINGNPKHPLYLPKETELEPWTYGQG